MGYDMTCEKRIEGVRENCCIHDLPASDKYAPGAVCCWCGLVYMDRERESTKHGQYLPKVFRPWKNKKR